MISKNSSLIDIAFEVSTALNDVGITAVLTGGSAATYYAPHAYQSADLDFVITFRGNQKGEEALSRLGYIRTNDYYKHPDSKFPLEFPPGPLAIGDDQVESWDTVKRNELLLHILSPTDCCRDRLCAFLFWNDFSGLEQALAVYQTQKSGINLEVIEQWCERENSTQKYELFLART